MMTLQLAAALRRHVFTHGAFCGIIDVRRQISTSTSTSTQTTRQDEQHIMHTTTKRTVGLVEIIRKRVYPLQPGGNVGDPSTPTASVSPGEYPLFRGQNGTYWFEMSGFANTAVSAESVPESDIVMLHYGDVADENAPMNVSSAEFTAVQMREMIEESDPDGTEHHPNYGLMVRMSLYGNGSSVVFKIQYGEYQEILHALTVEEAQMEPRDLLEKKIRDAMESYGDRVKQSQMDAMFDVLDELEWREPTTPARPWFVHGAQYSDRTGKSGTSIIEIEIPTDEIDTDWFTTNNEWTIASRVAMASQTSWWRRALDNGVFLADTTKRDGDIE